LADDFVDYQKQILANAQALASGLMNRGFNLVSDGTDTHLMLLNLGSEEDGGPSGKKMEGSLDLAGITANKNTVPFDTRPPFVASGIRLGTPAVTTRGMKEAEMDIVADFIRKVYDNYNNEEQLSTIKEDVQALCAQFPIFEELRK